MRARHILSCLSLSLVAFCTATVTLNQVDTFQTGTTQSWGGGSSPTNIPTGGPAGAADRYLQITSTGSNLATHNQTWNGDYISLGIDRIEVDLKNTGANPLTIRLVLFSTLGDRWSSNAAVVLPANSSWTHVAFDIAQANFTHTLGSGTWSDVITGVERAMFRHEPTISPNGTAVVGQLGLDNISAFAKTTPIGPTAFTVLSGVHVSGGLSELQASDNAYRVVRQNAVRSRQDPAVQADFSAFVPPGAFTTIEFRLEAATNAVPAGNLSQKIELFNFATNTFVTVDTRPMTGPDLLTVVTLPGNPNDFIGSGRQVHGKVSYFDPGTIVTRSWGVNFDWLQWKLIR